MGSAIGSSYSGRDHGSHVYDVRDFGAIPEVSTNAAALANSIAFQLAYDTAYANRGASLGGGKVYVPSGTWFLGTPVFCDKNYIGFVGDGVSATAINGLSYSDIFVLGIPRRPTGAPPTADHFPDAWTAGPGSTPIYDASAVTGPGQRWGIRTKGDSHVTQQGGPLDRGVGDGYFNTRLLTIAMYLDFRLSGTTIPPGQGSVSFPGSGSVMGMSTANYGTPWALVLSSGILYIMLSTVDAKGLNQSSNLIAFYVIPGTPGLVKIDLQIDLVNAQMSCYVNGLQSGVGTLPASFTVAAGMHFMFNASNPFGIGSIANSIQGTSGSFGATIDVTFWGLKLVAGLIYTNRNTAGTNDNAGVGTAQTRLDGQTNSDSFRYFAYSGSTEICRMLMQDSPAAIGVNSLVAVTVNNVPSPVYAFFADNSITGSALYPFSGAFFEGISFHSGSLVYGRALAVGEAYDLSIVHCNFDGGYQNIGAINASTNYPTLIEYCQFNASDACIYLNTAVVVVIRQCVFSGALVQVRLVYSGATIENCFSNTQGAPDYNIWSIGGGLLKVVQFQEDCETVDGGAQKAMVYARAGAGGSLSGLVSLDMLAGGRQATGSAIVILEDDGPEDGATARTCQFSMKNTSIEDSFCTTIVRNNSQRWRGVVEASMTPQRPTWIENTGVTGQGNVVSTHDHFIGPPRDGTWGKNANILQVRQPAQGQFTEWRCTATGSYGTPTAPLWQGFTPIDDGLSLAAYLQDTAYWQATSMPAKGQGFWSSSTAPVFLYALFGGSIPATPAGLYAGLAYRQSTRNASSYERGFNKGYARVSVGGAWTLTAAGAANTSAITFPTATADWNDVGNYFNILNSLIFYNAPSGGTFVAGIDIPPITVLSGQTLSYAPGAITIGRAASSLGAFADPVHAKMNGLWLNQVPLTVPTIYIALSTAPASLSPPAEPAGGGYARLPTTAATWVRNYINGGQLGIMGNVTNALPLTFASPTGGWGTIQSVYFMDALAGGNVLGSANLTVPRTILSGSPARSFAVGALWVSRS